MGITVTSTHAMVGNNTTVHLPVFQVTGTVRLIQVYGIVTVALGANHTASNFSFTDLSNTNALSANATTPASAAPPGTLIGVLGPSATATAVVSSSQARAGSPSANLELFQEYGAVANATTATYIGYSYATTDTPTTGTIEFFCVYQPLSIGAAVVAV